VGSSPRDGSRFARKMHFWFPPLAVAKANRQWLRAVLRVLDYLFHTEPLNQTMLFSKEYVGYLARELTKKLIAGDLIETSNVPAVTERVHTALLDQMSLQARIKA